MEPEPEPEARRKALPAVPPVKGAAEIEPEREIPVEPLLTR